MFLNCLSLLSSYMFHCIFFILRASHLFLTFFIIFMYVSLHYIFLSKCFFKLNCIIFRTYLMLFVRLWSAKDHNILKLKVYWKFALSPQCEPHCNNLITSKGYCFHERLHYPFSHQSQNGDHFTWYNCLRKDLRGSLKYYARWRHNSLHCSPFKLHQFQVSSISLDSDTTGDLWCPLPTTFDRKTIEFSIIL